ncbi:MAG TPA: LamG domain-containing protein, partial [Thermoplasmatales archaeon]|nr:LamG domain-containing protein [Thermoplasmatales archaeon]
ILVSSLRTNATDEDLICYALAPQGFTPKTFIYNWKRNGVPINDVLMPFDTQSSSTTNDYSGNGYVGTVNGATWISNGVVGGAYAFDGTDDGIFVSVPSIFNDMKNNDFTISMWLKSNDISTNKSVVKTILEVYIDDGNDVQIFQYNGSIQFVVRANGEKRVSIKTCELSNNVWYHIEAVWTWDNVTIYVNGTPYALPGLREYPLGDTVSMTLGQRTDDTGYFFGYIDEFYVYNYARSREQIYQDYIDTKDGSTDHRTLVSEETSLGESWSCTITPNNSLTDGTQINSEVLTIVSYGGGT